MQNYKMVFHKLTLALMGLVLFVGCIKPQKKSAADLEAEGADNNATFYAKEITGKAMPGKTGTSWDVTTSTQFDLQVCLSDKRTQDDVRLGTFTISGDDGFKTQKVRTDNNGCLNWQETVPFEMFGQPTYVTIQRKIHSLSTETGQRTLKIALNPWAAVVKDFPGDAVIDLTKRSVPDGQLLEGDNAKAALKGMAVDGSTPTRALIIDPVTISTDPPGIGGKTYTTHVHFAASVQTPDVSEAQTVHAFKHGKALIEFEWLMLNGKNKTVLAHAKTPSPIEMKNGLFGADFSAKISIPNDIGNLKFALKVTPVDAPANLGVYQGVFSIGPDYRSLVSSSSPKADANLSTTDNNNFSIESYVKGARTTQETDQDAMAPYIVDHLTSKYIHFKSGNENESTIGFSLRACIHDATRDSLRLKGLPVTVKTMSSGTLQLSADDQSCVTWDEKVVRQQYATSSSQHSVTLTIGAYSIKIPLLVNPLMIDTNPSQVITDLRDTGSGNSMTRVSGAMDIDPPSSAPSSARSKASSQSRTRGSAPIVSGGYVANPSGLEIILKSGYKSSQSTRSYQVGDHLTLKARQAVTLTLEPKIHVPGNSATGNASERPLSDGHYFVRAALRLPSLGNVVEEMIGVGDPQVVVAQAGVLTPIFNFDVDDFRIFGALSEIYIEISPVDEGKVGHMTPEQILKRYAHPSSLKPQGGAMWSSRLFVAPYLAGAHFVMDNAYPVDELIHAQNTGIDCSSNDQMSIAGNQTINANFFCMAKAYTNFDQLVTRSHQLVQVREARMSAIAQTGSMLKDLNAYGVDMADPRNKGYIQASGLNQIDIDAIAMRKSVSNESLQELCRYWAEHVVPQTLKEMNLSSDRYSSGLFNQSCQTRLSHWWPSLDFMKFQFGFQTKTPFVIDRRLKIVKATPYQRVDDPLKWNLYPGVSFSSTYTQSLSDTWTIAAETGAGIKGKVGFLSGEAAVATTVSRSKTNSVSVANAQTLSANQPLSVLKITEQFKVDSYRPCVVVTPSANMIDVAADAFLLMGRLDLAGLNEAQKQRLFAKRLMLCAGVTNRSQTVEENYYIVSEVPSDSNQVTPSNMTSNYWGRVIRGTGDYANFLSIIQGSTNRDDVPEALELKPDFINDYITPAMGHPDYIILN